MLHEISSICHDFFQNNKTRFLFCHMPRCGGRIMHQIFSDCFGSDNIAMFYAPRPGPLTLTHHQHSTFNNFYGDAQYIFSNVVRPVDDIRGNWDNLFSMILVRDPVSLVASRYKSHIHTLGIDTNTIPYYLVKDLKTVSAFSSQERNRNFITKSLGGIDENEPANDLTLKKAEEMINTFDWVGISDYFSISLCDLFRLIPPLGFTTNSAITSKGTDARQTLDKETIDFIEKNNTYDIALYNHAKSITLNRIKQLDNKIMAEIIHADGKSNRLRLALRHFFNTQNTEFKNAGPC